MKPTQPLPWIDLHLYVDMRKDKPFHCDKCGEDYDACIHWSPEDDLDD